MVACHTGRGRLIEVGRTVMVSRELGMRGGRFTEVDLEGISSVPEIVVANWG